MFRSRKGFTMTELLITIIIIGILATSLLLVFANARDRSTATRIVADLMTLKRASCFFFADKGRWPLEDDMDALVSYMGIDEIPEGMEEGRAIYGINSGNGTDIFISARVGNGNGITAGTRKILETEAPTYNLLDSEGSPYSANSDMVMVFLRPL